MLFYYALNNYDFINSNISFKKFPTFKCLIFLYLPEIRDTFAIINFPQRYNVGDILNSNIYFNAHVILAIKFLSQSQLSHLFQLVQDSF